MRPRFVLLGCCLVGLCFVDASAQSDACANPKARRFGVITLSEHPKSSDSDLMKRKASIELRFQNGLVKLLGPDVCLVRDMAVFSDPSNFPALKGSMVFEIQARPSLKNPKVAAIAVSISAVQGVYIEQNVWLGRLPILIESDADFDVGTKTVIEYWTALGQRLGSRP
jgi:hypothetical protein